jgi:parallel beta-helix repeat protein
MPLRSLFESARRLFRPNHRPAPARRQFRPQLESLEARWVPATLKVGATETYHTIQAAVTAAANSGTSNTILIDQGTYNEQVTIPSSITTANSLVINAANVSRPPTVKPTSTLNGSNAIFDVAGAKGVTIENLIIDGSGTSSAWFGVFVEQGGSATITSNTIQNMTATASTGGDTGFGIRVGRSSLSGQPATTGTADIESNIIKNYGKGGVDVANTGSSATVNLNTVTGQGHRVSENIQQVQNGIEVDDGATGTVSNNIVSKNGSALTGFGSAGILLFQPGSGVHVTNNDLSSNDVGIWVFDAASPTVSNNDVTTSTLYGIAFDTAGGAGVTGATVANNNSNNNLGDGFNIAATSNSTFSQNNSNGNGGNGFVLYGKDTGNTITQANSKSNTGNGVLVVFNDTTNSSYAATYGINSNTGNTFSQDNITSNHQTDAVDNSTGSGTAGTANTWSGNTIGTKSPGGLH